VAHASPRLPAPPRLCGLLALLLIPCGLPAPYRADGQSRSLASVAALVPAITVVVCASGDGERQLQPNVEIQARVDRGTAKGAPHHGAGALHTDPKEGEAIGQERLRTPQVPAGGHPIASDRSVPE
jgi:hypothetical protein